MPFQSSFDARINPCAYGKLVCHAVNARAGLDELRIDCFVLEAWAFGLAGEAGLGGFQKILVVAVGEIGFVVGAAGFVAEDCALNYGARDSSMFKSWRAKAKLVLAHWVRSLRLMFL